MVFILDEKLHHRTEHRVVDDRLDVEDLEILVDDFADAVR